MFIIIKRGGGAALDATHMYLDTTYGTLSLFTLCNYCYL